MRATAETIVIRPARTHHDAADLRRLAQLDSARLPGGELLVAEVDGELRAALQRDGGAVIADPFSPTADAVALLRTRARGLDSPHARRAVSLAGRRAARALWARNARRGARVAGRGLHAAHD